MEFSPWYSKSRPKVSDYNPLTHSTFYTKQGRATPDSFRTSYALNFHAPGKSYSKPFANIAARGLRSSSVQAGPSDRYYKTRPRNVFSDPITGVQRQVSVPRNRIESLDTRVSRDRFPVSLSVDYSLPSFTSSSKDRISGALRKDVPSVGYVNPFALKASSRQNARVPYF